MHYTAMAALRVRAAPDLYVNSSGTASAVAFLLPLIIGISTVGFILSAVISQSPTAAEMVAETKLMHGLSMVAQYDPTAPPTPPQRRAPSAWETEQGSLFRDNRGAHRQE
jgi:hypothetical protein